MLGLLLSGVGEGVSAFKIPEAEETERHLGAGVGGECIYLSVEDRVREERGAFQQKT